MDLLWSRLGRLRRLGGEAELSIRFLLKRTGRKGWLGPLDKRFDLDTGDTKTGLLKFLE